MELTSARGMMALERREDICSIACQAFSETNPDMSAKVEVIIRWWLEQAENLYGMMLMLKSQKKMTRERLHELKRFTTKYGIGWQKMITYKNPVFWTMHIMECGFIPFGEITGMSGISSTEGFEHKHYIMAMLRALLAPMVNTRQRVEKLAQRQQIHFLPGIQEKFEKIRQQQSAKTGVKRGPYKTKGTFNRNKEDIEIFGNDDAGVAPEGYFRVENGGLLPDDLSEMYNFYKRRLMPEEFYKPFQNVSELGIKAQRELTHF
jgi:hypothetical protein